VIELQVLAGEHRLTTKSKALRIRLTSCSSQARRFIIK